MLVVRHIDRQVLSLVVVMDEVAMVVVMVVVSPAGEGRVERC